MKPLCALFAITLALCPFTFCIAAAPAADANASSKDATLQQVKGQGPTKDEAIKNGLFQAVAQAKGVKVGSGDYSFGYRSASADINRTGTGKQVAFDAVSVQTAGTLQTTDIAGLVKTYEIIDEKKLDDGSYQVTLKVWVLDHLPVDKSARLRVAVMPIRTNWGSYIFAGLVMPADHLSDRLAQKLTTMLTQTNKFAVLDRQHISEYLHEQNVLFYSAPIEEQARIGEALGADFLLVGTVTEAGLRIERTATDAIANVTSTEYDADFAFDYSLIVAPSRQVKFSDTVRLHLETDEVKKLVKKWEPSELDYDEIADNLLAKAATEVVNKLSDRLYPPRIASIATDGSVIIDQGGDRFVTGTLLDVFKPDKQITDSDTKESLGQTEILVATVRIDKVAPNMSYASVVSGDASKLSQGLVCRIKSLPQQEPEGAKSRVERTPQGGVKLPFD
ncbi:MAG: CsgG/HfaB family protein [Planctomycetota bacterium]